MGFKACKVGSFSNREYAKAHDHHKFNAAWNQTACGENIQVAMEKLGMTCP